MAETTPLDQLKRQIFLETKQKELYMATYPACMDACESQNEKRGD